MKRRSLFGYALAITLPFEMPLLAQTVTLPGGVTTPPIVFQQSFTTGMVGFTTNQTARLNVFNMNSVPATTTTTTANCNVELQFFDEKGASLSKTVVPNFAPGAVTSLDLTRNSIISETAGRLEIRGAVVINPSPTPVGSPAVVGSCNVFTTLEVFDSTGSTISLTSDTRSAGLVTVVPVAVAAMR